MGNPATITVRVIGNAEDALYARQLVVVQQGLATLASQRVPLSEGLEIYLSSATGGGLLQAAYHAGPGSVLVKGTMFDLPEITKAEGEGVAKREESRPVSSASPTRSRTEPAWSTSRARWVEAWWFTRSAM